MENVPFYRLLNAQKIQFLKDVVDVGQEFDLPVLSLSSEFEVLSLKLSEIESGFGSALGSALTEEIVAQDARRDNALRCLRNVAKSFSSHFMLEKQNAGAVLLRTSNKYGEHIERMGLAEETTIIRSLIDDLAKEEASAALAELGLSELLTELTDSNTKLNNLWVERMKESGESESVSTSEMLKDTIVFYEKLAAILEAHHLVRPSEDMNKLYLQVGGVIDKYRSL